MNTNEKTDGVCAVLAHHFGDDCRWSASELAAAVISAARSARGAGQPAGSPAAQFRLSGAAAGFLGDAVCEWLLREPDAAIRATMSQLCAERPALRPEERQRIERLRAAGLLRATEG